jgi:predicted nucleic acid-binding protein
LLEQIKDAKHTAFESVIVPVEVAAAICRRTGSAELARRVRENLLRLPSFIFIELTESRMASAAEIAERTGLRGMDAIIVQVAKMRRAALVTLDEEMADRSRGIVPVKEIKAVLSR